MDRLAEYLFPSKYRRDLCLNVFSPFSMQIILISNVVLRSARGDEAVSVLMSLQFKRVNVHMKKLKCIVSKKDRVNKFNCILWPSENESMSLESS